MPKIKLDIVVRHTPEGKCIPIKILWEDGKQFHIDKVLDINCCHLQNDFGNQLRLFIKQYGKENGYSFYDLRAQQGLLKIGRAHV